MKSFKILKFMLNYCGLIVLLFSTAAWAGDKRSSFSLQFENDMLGNGTDQHYTHGFRLSSTHEEKREDALKALQAIADQLPGMGAECAEDINWLYNFSVGQNMFTPLDIWDPFPIEDDRPYAGWLYFNFGLSADKRDIKSNCKKIKQLSDTLDTLELSLGVVGPASQADHVQTLVHDVFGGVDPKGWGHQLKNEPVVNLTYNRQWRFAGEEQGHWDVIPHAGFALGTVYTYANAGATVRLGQALNADYGPPRIRPSVPGSDFIKSGPKPDVSWYLFASVEGRVVARNIFLDGNTFADSHSVDKYPLVGDVQTGAVLRYKDMRLSFTNILRSREFKKQQESSEFGALTLTLMF
jgi:lipid A 3-O-deacylase